MPRGGRVCTRVSSEPDHKLRRVVVALLATVDSLLDAAAAFSAVPGEEAVVRARVHALAVEVPIEAVNALAESALEAQKGFRPEGSKPSA